MFDQCISDCRLETTGFNYTMSLIQGKYKLFILYTLGGFGVVRFNEMKKYIGDISFPTRAAMEACRAANAGSWDDDEIYCVADELAAELPGVRFHAVTPWSGVVEIRA